VRRREELVSELERLAQSDGTMPIVQRYIPGRSLAVSALVHKPRVIARVAREALSYNPVAGGVPVWKRTLPPDAVGVEDVLRLLVALGYEGLVNVEYQVGADRVPRLMEFSARIHGSIPLVIGAGVDLPLLAARAALGEELPQVLDYRVGFEMRWPSGEVGRIREALGAGSALPPRSLAPAGARARVAAVEARDALRRARMARSATAAPCAHARVTALPGGD